MSTAVGDEGGFAPNLSSNEEALEVILEAIHNAKYKAGQDIFIALDIAASELYKDNKYQMKSEGKSLSSNDMVNYLSGFVEKYPIISIEDGLSENDWEGWTHLTAELGEKIQIVGDDLTVTNKTRLKRSINEKCMNAILIKLNQIGTVTETMEAVELAKDADFGAVISHRSGETEDTTIADLAVGTNAGQIKAGAQIKFNMHYAAIGVETTDRTRVGIQFYPKGVVPERKLISAHVGDDEDLDIPAGESDVRHDGFYRLKENAHITAFQAHLHNLARRER